MIKSTLFLFMTWVAIFSVTFTIQYQVPVRGQFIIQQSGEQNQ